jgi:hypothetical protein
MEDALDKTTRPPLQFDADNADSESIFCAPAVIDAILSPARNSLKRKRDIRLQIQGHYQEIVIKYTSRKVTTILTRSFRGAVTDTGALRSIFGVREAKCIEMTRVFYFLPCSQVRVRNFRLGNSTCPSLGLMRIAISALQGPLMVDVRIVDLEIPFLIGLDILLEQGIYVSASRRALVWHRA